MKNQKNDPSKKSSSKSAAKLKLKDLPGKRSGRVVGGIGGPIMSTNSTLSAALKPASYTIRPR